MRNQECELYEHCKNVIKVGSLSFSLAAKLFDKNMREGAFFLYSWCRHCDDALDKIDQRTDLSWEQRQSEKLKTVEILREKTLLGCRNPDQLLSKEDLPFIVLGKVVRKYSMPESFPLDLLEGMAMDAKNLRYATLPELERYCYHVAGVVGVMMSYVMGVSDIRALEHAKAMGNAMQMTNIARDILEDRDMQRCYLPLEWIEEAGYEPGAFVERMHEKKILMETSEIVKRLLSEAEIRYVKGYAGLKYLPLRAAFAVAAAGEVYSAIGRLVFKRGSHAWDSRTVVPLWLKLLAVARGGLRVLKLIPRRMIRKWERVELKSDLEWLKRVRL